MNTGGMNSIRWCFSSLETLFLNARWLSLPSLRGYTALRAFCFVWDVPCFSFTNLPGWLIFPNHQILLRAPRLLIIQYRAQYGVAVVTLGRSCERSLLISFLKMSFCGPGPAVGSSDQIFGLLARKLGPSFCCTAFLFYPDKAVFLFSHFIM